MRIVITMQSKWVKRSIFVEWFDVMDIDQVGRYYIFFKVI